MNNRIYQIIVAGVALIALTTACSKSFLETQPKQSVSESSATSTIGNLEYNLNGIHNYLYDTRYNQGYAGYYSYNIINDMMGEDLINSTRGNNWYILETQWKRASDPKSDQVYYTYNFFYKIIQNANLIINGVEKLQDNSDTAGTIKGEALALRAFGYFNLVQRYGKRYEAGTDNSQLGVPLRLEVAFVPMARNTVEEVYSQINKDLDEAISLLTKRDVKEKNRIQLLTALGLKARVALTQQDWATAEKHAILLIESAKKQGITLQKGEELLTGFREISNNSEWIWAYTQATDQNKYFASFFAYLSWNFSSGNIRNNPKLINSALYEQMSQTDIRRQWWDPKGEGTIAARYGKRAKNFKKTPYNSFKFAAESMGNSSGDFMYMRVGEFYYLLAEAYAHQNKTEEAQTTLYNIMITRDPEYKKSNKSGEELLQEILTNRRIDLWGEGHRWTDLKRLNLPLNRSLAPNTVKSVSEIMEVPAGDKRWQYLFHEDEINASKGLIKQNEV